MACACELLNSRGAALVLRPFVASIHVDRSEIKLVCCGSAGGSQLIFSLSRPSAHWPMFSLLVSSAQ